MRDATDPFADLESDLEESAANHSEDVGTTEEHDSSEEAQGTHHSLDQPQSLDEPAFPFDATKQDPLYARPETWDAFNDTLLEVELALRDYDIRDVPKRELHDAALQVLTNHSDELKETMVAARRGSGP